MFVGIKTMLINMSCNKKCSNSPETVYYFMQFNIARENGRNGVASLFACEAASQKRFS